MAYAPVAVPLLRLSHDGMPAAYAVGFAPFGLSLTTKADGVRPVAGVALGGLVSSRRIPSDNANNVNVTVEGHVSCDIGRWRVGYRFLHISNVYTAAANPGIDGHLLTVGWRRH
jgi:hypothetical protein